MQGVMGMNLAVLAGYFVAIWFLSLVVRDASIVDIGWGLSFVVVAWVTWSVTDPTSWREYLLILLVTVWGLRLSGYLAWRNLGQPEDHRYRKMRESHGAWFPLVSLFTVFLLQGAIAWVVSFPVQAGVFSSGRLSSTAYLGVGLFVIGLVFETVGDYQLARFKADPDNQGVVMDQGLWRYTRHPNYFGDFMVWWGLYAVAATPGNWWWTAIGPAVMSVCLIWVSGVRHLENAIRNRREGYEEYVNRTSPFFPMPPK